MGFKALVDASIQGETFAAGEDIPFGLDPWLADPLMAQGIIEKTDTPLPKDEEEQARAEEDNPPAEEPEEPQEPAPPTNVAIETPPEAPPEEPPAEEPPAEEPPRAATRKSTAKAAK